MRLIDADDLKVDCIKTRAIANAPRELYVSKKQIDLAPTIDPVKHGKWLNTSTDIPNLLMNVCSECGFQYPSAIRPRFNHCPNCGALMDKGEPDDH